MYLSRGRKKKDNSYTENYCIKINKQQKELLQNNKSINQQLKNDIRDYLNRFLK